VVRKLFGIAVILHVASWVVQAGPIFPDVLYNDPAIWSAAVTGVTNVNLEGIVPPSSYAYVGRGAGANTTVDGVNFAIGPSSNGYLWIIGDDFYYPGTAVITSQESTTPFNDLLITLPDAVTALGFYFGDAYGDTATITLSDGTVQLQTALAGPYLGFFGVTAPGGVTQVDITTPDVVMNVSDVSYGSSVPEPIAPILSGMGIALIGVLLRRRRPKVLV
jgi:hypothetical protein